MGTDQLLVRSGFAQVVEDGDRALIWHSLFGHPKIVSAATARFLERFAEPTTAPAALGRACSDADAFAVDELRDAFFLIEPDFDERAHLSDTLRHRDQEITNGSRIDFLELIMSEACNFRCTYCIHFNNLETSDRISAPNKFMRFDTATVAVDGYLDILRQHQRTSAEINFGGGEPLLAWPVIQRVLDYCTSRYGDEFEFVFTINTNASLITPEIAAELKHYSVSVASSLDGLQDGNDQVRLTKSGKGTWPQIVQGFDALAEAGYPLEGIAITVTHDNFAQLDESVIDWAVERGMGDVRIDIDVIDMVEVPVEEIVAKLVRIRRYAQGLGVDVPGFWSRPVENLNESTLAADVAFCGAVRGNSMCVSPTGKIYGCGYSTTQLGSLVQLTSFTKQDGRYHRFVRDRLTGAMEMCRGCMIEGQCGGGCNITQEFARATETAKIDRMCDFYRAMTRELLLEQLHALTEGGEMREEVMV